MSSVQIARICTLFQELSVANKNLARIRSELDTIKTRHVKEIEKIRLENSELVTKEVIRAREETKKAMTIILPAVDSRETQTDPERDEKTKSSKSSSRSSSGRNRIVPPISSPPLSSSSSGSFSPNRSPPKSASRVMVDAATSDRGSSDRSIEKLAFIEETLERHSYGHPIYDRNEYYHLKESLQMVSYDLYISTITAIFRLRIDSLRVKKNLFKWRKTIRNCMRSSID